jgi:riboflavin synthase
MFTGLIRAVGRVTHVAATNRDTRYKIQVDDFKKFGLQHGASISCNGVCLTIVDFDDVGFAIEASTETLQKTTMTSWRTGTLVNLEPSLRMGDELGGHLVMGHVDATARILSITPEGGSHRVRLQVPITLMTMLAAKGSVALDGMSLTVNDVMGDSFGVNIIPYTWDHTNFSDLKVGDAMNFEVDMLARYVQRMLDARLPLAAAV